MENVIFIDNHLIPNIKDEEDINKANEHLKRSIIPLICKKLIPKNSLPFYGLSGTLNPNLTASEGRILSRWNDSGWGNKVVQDKLNKYFSDELVLAVKEMIVESWCPDPAPTWITCVPSLTNLGLVEDFTKRLSNTLNIPFISSIEKIKKNDFQKKQENTFFQFNNLDGVFKINQINQGPVLLVDDIVDSTATMTLLSALLLNKEVEAVFPCALATTNFGNV